MITLFRTLGKRLTRTDWGNVLRHEVVQIQDDRAIKRNSLRVRYLEDSRIVILFTLKTDRVSDPERGDILDEEPIALVYPEGKVGTNAPFVCSDRKNFPRDLTHLNPVSNTSPVSICLAREGLQAVYERFGVKGVIERLRDWLRDARTDSLNRDGWEPISVAVNSAVGLIDGERSQTFAWEIGDDPGWGWSMGFALEEKTPKQRWSTGLANSYFFPHEGLLRPDGPLLNHVDQMYESAVNALRGIPSLVPVPTIFAWQDQGTSEGNIAFHEYSSAAELREDLGKLGLKEKLDNAIGQFLTWGPQEYEKIPRAIVALIGVRRPLPIVGDRFGLANHQEARRLEIKAFVIRAQSARDLLEDRAEVREIALMPLPSRGLSADVSGVHPKQGVCIVGYGALGSEIAGFFARMGVGEINVIDNDVLLSHNLARHEATLLSLGLTKANAVQHLDTLLHLSSDRSFQGYTDNVVHLSAEELATRMPPHAVLIDASASDSVRRSLPIKARELSKRIIRVEIFDEGYLGVQSVEGDGGNPDLLDLYYMLCQLGLIDEAVRRWLITEIRNRSKPQTVASGFSCTSATLRLPKWIIASHAAAFMPRLTLSLDGTEGEAGVGLNALSRDGTPMGWSWYAVPSLKVYNPSSAPGWEVRIADDVCRNMRVFSKRQSPRETGGYLYGGWNLDLQRITVTAATPEPPETKGSTTALNLGRSGKTKEERLIQRYCGQRISLVGTWHSHPQGSAQMSGRDQRTLSAFRRENEKRALPTLLVICGKRSIGVHLEV